jgi:hypothetical protein
MQTPTTPYFLPQELYIEISGTTKTKSSDADVSIRQHTSAYVNIRYIYRVFVVPEPRIRVEFDERLCHDGHSGQEPA